MNMARQGVWRAMFGRLRVNVDLFVRLRVVLRVLARFGWQSADDAEKRAFGLVQGFPYLFGRWAVYG